MEIKPFNFVRLPQILFGEGTFQKLYEAIMGFGNTTLIVTGGESFRHTEKFDILVNQLVKHSIKVYDVSVKGEPSPDLIDKIVDAYRNKYIDVVVAIGGGSVLDAGKAISAMLMQNDSVLEYLEGVGSGKIHNGEKAPFIAVPTTSGTGSEATKNAVLSRVGKNGFKKSLRHDNFVPDIAVLDPILTISCPTHITAASGLDAFTQLLGGYLSTEASPMTDTMALSGLQFIKDCLVTVCTTGTKDVNVRAGMAYASLMSGIVLANAGLGIVHGFASPIGGYFDIPHGVVCGTLVGEAVKMNIKLLRQIGNKDNLFLKKYAKVGALLSEGNEEDVEESCNHLIAKLDEWTELLKIPRLGKYHITENDLDKIVEGTGNKNNPVKLTKDQMKQILRNRL